MHEMSIVDGLINIVRQEMVKNEVTRLLKVQVKFGRLTNIVPDALYMGFEALTKGTDFDGAILEVEEIPMRVRCCKCRHEFSPEAADPVFIPCPACGEEFGHEILSGKELYIDHIEAE